MSRFFSAYTLALPLSLVKVRSARDLWRIRLFFVSIFFCIAIQGHHIIILDCTCWLFRNLKAVKSYCKQHERRPSSTSRPLHQIPLCSSCIEYREIIISAHWSTLMCPAAGHVPAPSRLLCQISLYSYYNARVLKYFHVPRRRTRLHYHLYQLYWYWIIVILKYFNVPRRRTRPRSSSPSSPSSSPTCSSLPVQAHIYIYIYNIRFQFLVGPRVYIHISWVGSPPPSQKNHPSNLCVCVCVCAFRTCGYCLQ